MCNCANKTRAVLNTSFTEVMTTAQIYEKLTEEQRTEFTQVIYLGRATNHLIPIKSQRAVEIGLKNYGVGRNGMLIWVHTDELINNNPLFQIPVAATLENVVELSPTIKLTVQKEQEVTQKKPNKKFGKVKQL
ncbi:MAG: hypothetical protein E6R13_07610 [Spirochaetes bacterium]|nr:MAG: hypothetical protein E6R13_07610 [Spirochaetota bacterium]